MAGGMYMHTSIIIAENAHEAEDATKARLKKAYGGFQTVNRVKIHTPNRGISLRIEDIQSNNEYPLTIYGYREKDGESYQILVPIVTSGDYSETTETLKELLEYCEIECDGINERAFDQRVIYRKK